MAKKEKPKKEPKQKAQKQRAPKIVVGDFPYVSLMPESRKTAIEVAEAKSKWIRTVVGGAIVAVMIAIASVGFNVIHGITYAAATMNADAVEAEILNYGEVDDALSIKKLIEGNIVEATSAAINWQDVLNRVAKNLPGQSSVDGFSGIVGGTAEDDYSAVIIVNIASAEPISYAQILDSFEQIEGILPKSIQVGNLTTNLVNSTTIYYYPVAFTMDSSVLSQRYAYLSQDDSTAAPAAEKQDSTSEETPATPAPTETPEETEN